MTQISSILNKYKTHNKYNIIFNSKYYTYFNKFIDNEKFTPTLYNNIYIFNSYHLYFLDIDQIKTISDIYQKYLIPIVVLDDEVIGDKNTEYCASKLATYNRYRDAFPISFITTDLEQYLYHKDLYDYYMNNKDINSLLKIFLIHNE